MQLKNYILFIATYICVFTAANAQEERTKRISLSGRFIYDVPNKNFQARIPQIGFGWQNKKQNWHDVDLLGAALGFGGGGSHIVSFGARYQYTILPFKRFEETKFKPFIGIGGQYGVSHFRSSLSAPNFDTRNFNNSLQAHISPGFEYHFSKKFYASFQLPVTIASFNTISSRVFDPALSASEQRSSASDFKLFPFKGVEARAGIGYKF